MNTLEIQNLKRFKTYWKLFPKEMDGAIQDGVRDVTLKLENQGKRESPVGKVRGGNLRQSIRSYFPKKMMGVVTAGAKYARYVHDGTRPHTIRTKSKKVLANKRSGQIFGKVVNHPGTKANPFFDRAVDKTNYPKIFNAQITRAINKL